MSALGLVIFKHRPNKNYTLFYAYCNTWKSKQIIILLTIASLCHKGIHIPSLCAFYGNALRKILRNKRRRSRRAHTESAVNTPLVTEQMTESVHTTSLWPSWNGKSGKPLFIHRLAHACVQMCLENHFLFIYIYIERERCVGYIYPSMTECKIDLDNLFCFMPHSCCRKLAHSRCICRFNIDINW